MSTKIEWTDETWNPTIGCSRVSAGCEHCFAERLTNRLALNPTTPEYAGLAENGRWTGAVKCLPERLDIPLRWRKPKRIFVNSMSDLFHEDVPTDFIFEVFRVIETATRHTFIVLTKRPERMATFMHEWVTNPMYGRNAPPANAWLGVSVEDQATADERIPWLLKTPAAVRFVSCEPLLGEVSFRWAMWAPLQGANHLDGLRALDWVITGGETGPGARPAHPDWFRGIRDQCAAAGVSYFHKQNGEFAPTVVEAGGDLGGNIRAGKTVIVHMPGNPSGYFRKGDVYMSRVGKARAGRLLDGVEHNAYPEVAP